MFVRLLLRVLTGFLSIMSQKYTRFQSYIHSTILTLNIMTIKYVYIDNPSTSQISMWPIRLLMISSRHTALSGYSNSFSVSGYLPWIGQWKTGENRFAMGPAAIWNRFMKLFTSFATPINDFSKSTKGRRI